MIKIKMKIAYKRVSTDEQANEGFSIIYQIRCALNLAAKRKLDNIEEFIDDGYSATNLNRPAMKKLINLIENDFVSDLIVYDLDRLSRDTIECMTLHKVFYSLYYIHDRIHNKFMMTPYKYEQQISHVA